jgi:serine/threonine-protein kinase
LFDQLIDQYKLQEHVAQKSVTDLYLAYDVDENLTVAVEILLPRFVSNKTFANRFLDQMQALAQLRHPHIAQIYQVGVTPWNRPYIAREHIDGLSLARRLKQLSQQESPVHPVYALKLVRQIAEALALAERLEIFHHDLRPENILLKMDDTAVLTELGVPRIDSQNGTSPSNLQTNGLDYLSPEQLQGKSIDSRSHVYSLGVILYEMLADRRPAQPSSLWHTTKRVVTADKTPLEHVREDLTADTYRLVDKCLQKEPWRRYQTIKELIEAIEGALKEEDLQRYAGAGTEIIPTSRGFRRFLPPLMLLVASMAIISLSLYYAWQPNNTVTAPPGMNGAGSTANNPVAVVEPSATATATATASQTATAVSTETTMQILAPPPDSQFEMGDTVTFTWSWPEALETGQQFVVSLHSSNVESVVGTVAQPDGDSQYRVEAPTSTIAERPGVYQWQITLQDTASDTVLAQSVPRWLEIVPVRATATATATEAPSPTATVTATPPIRVRVLYSSVGLRTGPGIHYHARSFLREGDVVTVIGKDSEEGFWYNVELENGARGWIAASVSEVIEGTTLIGVPTAATIPASPTPTNTLTPTPTNTPTNTPTPTPEGSGGGSSGGGGGDNPTRPPATSTPPPPPPPPSPTPPTP